MAEWSKAPDSRLCLPDGISGLRWRRGFESHSWHERFYLFFPQILTSFFPLHFLRPYARRPFTIFAQKWLIWWKFPPVLGSAMQGERQSSVYFPPVLIFCFILNPSVVKTTIVSFFKHLPPFLPRFALGKTANDCSRCVNGWEISKTRLPRKKNR